MNFIAKAITLFKQFNTFDDDNDIDDSGVFFINGTEALERPLPKDEEELLLQELSQSIRIADSFAN